MQVKILQICAAPDNWIALFEDADRKEMHIPVCAFALVEDRSGRRYITSISEDQGEGVGKPDCECENWRGYMKLTNKRLHVAARANRG